LNPAQELVQDEGDRDFRGGIETIAALVEALRVPVIAEGDRLRLVAGHARAAARGGRRVGGRVGARAARPGPAWRRCAIGASARGRRMLREWGIPTAASVAYARRAGFATLASGGIRGALDVVRALALGAHAAGMALPFLRAYECGGARAVATLCEELTEGVRALLLLSVRGAPQISRRLRARSGRSCARGSMLPRERGAEMLAAVPPTRPIGFPRPRAGARRKRRNRIVAASLALFATRGYVGRASRRSRPRARLARGDLLALRRQGGPVPRDLRRMLVPFFSELQASLEHIPPRERVFEILSAYERVVEENENAIRSIVRWLLESEKLRASLRETLFALPRRAREGHQRHARRGGRRAGCERAARRCARRDARRQPPARAARPNARNRELRRAGLRRLVQLAIGAAVGSAVAAPAVAGPPNADRRALAGGGAGPDRARDFPVALRWLPRALRRDLIAIYGAARLIDQAAMRRAATAAHCSTSWNRTCARRSRAARATRCSSV